MKENIKIFIAIVIGLIVMSWTGWAWIYSSFLGKLAPVQILDEFELTIKDYEIKKSFLSTSYLIYGENRNLQSNRIYNYDLEQLDFNLLEKGEVLKCKKIKKGISTNYVCGTEEKQIPEDVDLNLTVKVLLVLMISLFWFMGVGSRR